MPRIVQEEYYDGFREKVERLGLGPLYAELREIACDFRLTVKEDRDSNGGAAVRKMLDARFAARMDWVKVQTGDVDWTKCHSANGTRVCIGVEVQFSARSDLLVMDVHHLRSALTRGEIDVGVLLVPSDRLSVFLTDRAPCFADALRHVRGARAEDLPLVVLGLEHDGAGEPLAKQTKRPTRGD